MPATSVLSGAATSVTAVHDLKTLVLSRHPVIVIESAEEDRTDALLRSVAVDLRLPLYDWTVTRGLRRVGEPAVAGPLYGSEEPLKALAGIAEISFDALFCLKDLGAHLATPVASRSLRELAVRFDSPRRLSTLVLTGARVELPPELDAATVRFELPPPAPAEYRRALVTLAEQLGANGRVRVNLGDADFDELARAAAGLTLGQARQAVAHAALEDGELNSDDLAVIVERKARRLAADGLLELFPAADNRTELGGFSRLKGWLERAHVGYGAEARELGLEPPRGLMLVGVQGGGKSLAAKFVARQWRLPLLKLDAGRLYDKFIGESERNFRRATALAESIAPCVLWIDEIEKAMTPGGGDSDSGLGRRLFGSS
jgi:hypothetical protein